ncbi:tyrosine-type recombinase/integrase [Stieleria sp. TO1_6]|uniref:tyrosine-type recombinase/integrase n=1 Tax=Stieleria tagensis TaxID=2956795 RepID=UPI00209AB620|nr:tyrosine-type recombinase/integrase [Stieleria tagensis]MCO8122866.1 tyrosine-type recombinase/integrase [Stieleria tagensis]
MPREPKPYYRKAQKRWVCTINGQRVTLGPNKQQAFEKYHALMLDQQSVRAELCTLYELTQSYLDWVQDNRKKVTYDKHKHYLKSFIQAVGKTMKPSALKPHHLTTWTNKDSWSSTSRNDAITIVQRMLNWSIDQGYLSSSPIPRIKKPKAKRREIVYTPEQWKQIKSHAIGPLIPFLDFIWATGCRPKEARTMEARHIHDDLVIFPPDESKGETDSRVIFMTPQAQAIIKPLLSERPTGPLFLNSDQNPWTKDSIKCRLTRITKKVGFRVIAYGARHSYATNALIRSVDTVSLSHLMGHKDTRMINNYAHLAQNVDFLRQQARNAAG